jgi:hypothetical protein
MQSTLTLSLWLCLHGLLVGQGGPERRHELFIDALKQTAADITAQSLVDIHRLEQWQAARPELYQQYMYSIGLDPLPTRTPLQVEITGTLKRPRYRIEKIVYQSMPGLYVTGTCGIGFRAATCRSESKCGM